MVTRESAASSAPDCAGRNGAHTPGPWFADGHRVYGPSQDGKCYVLASTAFFYDQEDANARLIAAAPELLAEIMWLRANLRNATTSAIEARLDAAIALAAQVQS